MSQSISIIAFTTFMVVTVLLLSYYLIQRFYRYTWIPYKKSISNRSFEDLIIVLKMVINSELDAYENDIFQFKGSLTNSNFNQYYNDLTMKITKSLPNSFMEDLEQYLTEAAIVKIIAREVKKFLNEHIHGTY